MDQLEYQRKANRAEITLYYGTDFFYVGMPLVKLNDILWNYYYTFGSQQNSGSSNFYHITLNRSIRISIEVIKQVVYKIEFFNKYIGTYEGVGIGSTIEDLLAIRRDVFLDEEYVLVGEPHGLVIQINNQKKHISSIEDILEKRIISLAVEDKSLLKKNIII